MYMKCVVPKQLTKIRHKDIHSLVNQVVVSLLLYEKFHNILSCEVLILLPTFIISNVRLISTENCLSNYILLIKFLN